MIFRCEIQQRLPDQGDPSESIAAAQLCVTILISSANHILPIRAAPFGRRAVCHIFLDHRELQARSFGTGPSLMCPRRQPSIEKCTASGMFPGQDPVGNRTRPNMPVCSEILAYISLAVLPSQSLFRSL